MPMEWTSFTLNEEVPKSLQSPCIITAMSPQGARTCQLLLTCARVKCARSGTLNRLISYRD